MWTITGIKCTLMPPVLFLFLGLPEFKAALLLSFALCLGLLSALGFVLLLLHLQGLLRLGADALRDGLPAGFPELPLRILPVFRRRGRIDCLAVSEPVPVPVNELHNLPLQRLGPESDRADPKPFPVGQYEEANPERVFEKNG